MANSDLATGACSSDLVIQTLKWARKQGFKPVPLRKQSKAALNPQYVDLKYKPPGDDFWQAQDLGVGVVTGPSHEGPVDIDLDCDEAIFFAKRFLPQTGAVFGRKSKPASHYLYRVEGALSKKAFNDPMAKAGTTIIEIRADGGHQTVFPGSVHETTGELIEWADIAFPEVPRVEEAVLDFAVKKVAIATLITRHIWADGQRNEVCKHLTGMFYYLDWTEAEVTTLIEAIMEYTDDNDRTRLRTVAQTYKKGEAGGKITGSNSLRTFLGDARLVDRILEWAGNAAAALLQDYNERYAVVSVEGKFRIAETLTFEPGQPPMFYTKDDFLNIMAPDTIPGDKGPIPKAKIWLASPRRRTYKTVDFLPGVEDASPILNLWTGWGLKPSANASCQAWLDLLFYTICGGDEPTYNWMLHWFANIVKEPLSKALTAPVIIGKQGAGKSLLFSYFGKILGGSYVTVTNEEHIYGRFNQHLGHALLLHAEEALYGGERKHKNIIKSLITDNTRIFERKGIDAKTVKNYMRIALTSNEAWAAPAEDGDRRYTVLDLGDRKIKPAAIREILDEMNNGGPAALFHFLLNDLKYDREIPRTNIKNEALLTLKQINFDPISAWWYETLKSGQMLPDYLAWAEYPEREEWPRIVSSAALHMAMATKVKDTGQRYIPDPTSFSIKLNKMVGDKLERQQKYFMNPMSDQAPADVRRLANKQYAIINMPRIERCRASFEDYVGQPMEWPEDAKDEDKPAHMKY